MNLAYLVRLATAALKSRDRDVARLTLSETLRRVVDENAALARFGDGELKIALYGGGLRFQKHSRALQEALCGILREPAPRVLPCLNHIYADTPHWQWIERYERYPKTPDAHLTRRHPNDIMVLHRKAEQLEYRRHRRIVEAESRATAFGDTGVFYLGLYLQNYADDDMESVLDGFRKLFRGRRILFVAPSQPMGGRSFLEQLPLMQRLGLRSAEFIAVPATDAFEHRNEVMAEILGRTGFDDLFLQAGPAATVWVNELADRIDGRVLDVGSLNTQLRYL